MKSSKSLLLLLSAVFIFLSCKESAGSDSPSPTSSAQISLDENTTPPIKDWLLGDFSPSDYPQTFTRIDDEWTTKTDVYLYGECYEAFLKMANAAKAEGIDMVIVSAFRSFSSQKWIWENKWNGGRKVEGIDLTTIDDPVERAEMILLYSSMPGTSRHHWGTDFDINALENSYFESGEGLILYEWMLENAREYGFYQVYTAFGEDTRTSGYQEEKWHWSYLPVASKLLSLYKENVGYSDLFGFDGSSTAQAIGMIDHYVFGIDSQILEYEE